jgi:RIO-like serine/threonine protein kinase
MISTNIQDLNKSRMEYSNEVKNKSTRLGGGKEGDVYKYDDPLRIGETVVLKIYKPHISSEKMRNEFMFLAINQKSGAVPVLYSGISQLEASRTIIMEYLQDYMTLADFLKVKSSYTKDQINKLLIELAKNRMLIGKDIFYSDLHSKNIMVNMKEPNSPKVKMLDPGRYYVSTDAWLEWTNELFHEMHVLRLPFAKIVKTGNVTAIQKLIN